MMCRVHYVGDHRQLISDLTVLENLLSHDGFSSINWTMVIDEALRVPELFPTLRVLVDENRRPGYGR